MGLVVTKLTYYKKKKELIYVLYFGRLSIRNVYGTNMTGSI